MARARDRHSACAYRPVYSTIPYLCPHLPTIQRVPRGQCARVYARLAVLLSVVRSLPVSVAILLSLFPSLPLSLCCTRVRARSLFPAFHLSSSRPPVKRYTPCLYHVRGIVVSLYCCIVVLLYCCIAVLLYCFSREHCRCVQLRLRDAQRGHRVPPTDGASILMCLCLWVASILMCLRLLMCLCLWVAGLLMCLRLWVGVSGACGCGVPWHEGRPRHRPLHAGHGLLLTVYVRMN